MIKSMTGFSRKMVEIGSDVMSLEIKGVNNRFLDIGIKMPEDFNYIEEDMKSLIRSEIKRGRVDVRIKWKNTSVPGIQEVNEELLCNLFNQAKAISEKLQVEPSISLETLLLIPGVVGERKVELEEGLLKKAILKALKEGLKEFNQMRFDEGQRLKTDIEHRLDLIIEGMKKVKEYQHTVVEEYRDRLNQRVSKLKIEGLEIDENRFLAEIALYAERCNITEEIVRLESHITEFRLTINKGEGVGRKLDFLLQELNREINTIGSKSNNYQIAKLVVDIKGEIEKIREQVQNVE